MTDKNQIRYQMNGIDHNVSNSIWNDIEGTISKAIGNAIRCTISTPFDSQDINWEIRSGQFQVNSLRVGDVADNFIFDEYKL